MTTLSRNTGSDSLVIFGYRLVAIVTRFTPTFVVAGLTAVLVPLITVLMRKQRAIVARHMQRIQPDLQGRNLRRAVQKSYESYARYYIETFRLPLLNAKKFKLVYR